MKHAQGGTDQAGPAKDDPRSPSAKMWAQAAGYSYVGIFFGVAVAIGYLAGNWADHRWHTGPWLALVGALLGIAASFKELYRLTVRFRKEERRS